MQARQASTVSARLLVVAGAMLVGVLIAFFFWIGPSIGLTNPILQKAVPTAGAVPTERSVIYWWTSQEWLNQDDARALRTKSNVVNLALLENAGARYHARSTVNFDPKAPWKQTRPFGMRDLAVEGTAVRFNLRNNDYTLNVFQPFVHIEDGGHVYVVDRSGNVWEANYSDISLVSLDRANISGSLTPNPNLSFTLGGAR